MLVATGHPLHSFAPCNAVAIAHTNTKKSKKNSYQINKCKFACTLSTESSKKQTTIAPQHVLLKWMGSFIWFSQRAIWFRKHLGVEHFIGFWVHWIFSELMNFRWCSMEFLWTKQLKNKMWTLRRNETTIARKKAKLNSYT